ncbi:hypothetical protein JFU49_03310 [Pseudomonas sp. TH03]|uniref:hypothetical protein n=1 Tax=Pseudomonas sp. TH03 TaxID=2796369 RepID=UPI001911DD7C|nr:hypothetical protein [Pseudomonas sp. TH03]MBK5549315.1 hypothetical protein [Pseudomonas sp. TH03]
MDRPSENVISYTDFSHDDYWEAINWLKDQGLNVSSSRYAGIMRDIGDFGEGEYPKELIWGLSEVDTLYRVYLGVLKRDLVSKDDLKKLLNGAKFLKDEKIGASDNSRNYIFELQVAGAFVKAGAGVRFDNTKADFKFELQPGITCFAECKRVSSEQKLEANVKEAYKQIQERCSEHDVGVIAVDISRLMWQRMNGNLVCSSFADIKSFLQKISDDITKSIKAKYVYCNTIMVAGFYCVPFVSVETGGLNYFRNMSASIKYCEDHLLIPYSLMFMQRARVALWMKDNLKLSFQV